MLSLFMLLSAVIVTVVNSQLIFGDPCNLEPITDPESNKKHSLDIPANCKNGSIDWDYPQGSVNIHLALPGESFSLCLVHTSLTLIGGLQVLTTGEAVQIPLPTAGKDACSTAINGEVRLLVTASTNQYYWTRFAYKVLHK